MNNEERVRMLKLEEYLQDVLHLTTGLRLVLTDAGTRHIAEILEKQIRYAGSELMDIRATIVREDAQAKKPGENSA